jgi:hypothetical protein
MNNRYKTRVTRIVILPDGETVYSEMATTVEIDDESGGEFVIVSQDARSDLGKIAINPEEWPALRAAINRMVKACSA